MTCEVAVINKYAVVIAADSAITTSSANGKERYSKGGNKIFQLSRFEPVGIMIYGSATLDGVPWEVIIKDFRDRLGNAYLYRCYDSALPQTGIVFSGFGEDQYFPAVSKFEVWGLLRNDFLYTKDDDNSCEVSHNTQSGIFQFAMTSSIDTFTTGVGLDTYSEVQRAYQQSAQTLVQQVLKTHNIDVLPSDFHQTLVASASAFSDDWLNKMLATHYHPMKRVIASLSIQEMAHLAETLIVLQSLKERITTHSESVGGPVDIAVITKSEGLVWIKRKHYFNAESNLQYTLRQRALYGD